jgi:hypothetical protein
MVNLNNIELVHYTHKNNLSKILESGKLYDQKDRAKFTDIIVGEGDFNRKLCDPMLKEVDFDKCNEAYGVYFRVHVQGKKFIKPKRNHVAIVLSGNILHKYKWHINYCENNGFFIRDHNVPFGDGRDDCPNSCNSLEDIDISQIDPYDSEILIHKTVSILRNKYLLRVVDDKNEEIVNVHLLRTSLSPQSIKSRSRSKTSTRKSRSLSRRSKSRSYSLSKTRKTKSI